MGTLRRTFTKRDDAETRFKEALGMFWWRVCSETRASLLHCAPVPAVKRKERRSPRPRAEAPAVRRELE
jgi:hypothetical protein